MAGRRRCRWSRGWGRRWSISAGGLRRGGGGRPHPSPLPASLGAASRPEGAATGNLQQAKAAVLGKVAVESDGIGDAQSLHDSEAHGIAKRVGLVFMGAHEIEGSGFVGLTHALDLVFVALDGVEKSQRAAQRR